MYEAPISFQVALKPNRTQSVLVRAVPSRHTPSVRGCVVAEDTTRKK